MDSEPLARLLGRTPELRPLAEQLARIKRLQKRYRAVVPGPLAEASRICAIDGTVVVICAANGAVASALRQLAPRVLEGLRKNPRKSPKHAEDQDFTSIRVEVQVVAPQPRRAPPARAPLPRERLAKVAGKLAESPLRETLERIAGDQASSTRRKT